MNRSITGGEDEDNVDHSENLQDPDHTLPYIQCRDLFKIFKRADLEVVALRGIDLDIEPGEMVAIVGTSGSGKSTLLNILSGLERPSAGQVRVGAKDLLNITDRELVMYRRIDVGFVWQAVARNLIPYLTVKDNIELPQALAGRTVDFRRARSEELLTVLNMEDKSNRKIHELSGGEQQRLAIAVAMANNPPLILADEPTGELDTQMATQVFQQLRDMNSIYGSTIVVVTHYPGVAEHVDRVLHIRDGRISSESYMDRQAGLEGDKAVSEFIVVDRVGRLQLPQEYVERLSMSGLVEADLDDLHTQVNIKPVTKHSTNREARGQNSKDNQRDTQ